MLDNDDSVELHVRDTQDVGAGLVDEHAARFIAEHSGGAIEWLVAQGLPFTTDPEGPLCRHLTREGGHAVQRIEPSAHRAERATRSYNALIYDHMHGHHRHHVPVSR